MMMRAIYLFVLLLSVASSQAQTASAEEYFNRAAREYVKKDKLASLKTLDKGLQAHPGDARMLKLAEELLKEQQQQQAQQQQQKQKDEQQQKEEQKQQAEQKKEQQQEQQAQQGERKDGEQKSQPGRIAPQDAERILDALERQEQGTQDKVRARMRPVQRRRIEKDW